MDGGQAVEGAIVNLFSRLVDEIVGPERPVSSAPTAVPEADGRRSATSLPRPELVIPAELLAQEIRPVDLERIKLDGWNCGLEKHWMYARVLFLLLQGLDADLREAVALADYCNVRGEELLRIQERRDRLRSWAMLHEPSNAGLGAGGQLFSDGRQS